MRADCGDVRFATMNHTELPYTLETSTCNSTDTIFWVWSNLTGKANTTIFVYYGNSSAMLPTSYTKPDDKMILYMHFDNDSAYGEDSTRFFDFSLRGNDGTCVSNTCPKLTSGRFGNAYLFNVSSRIIISDSQSLNLSTVFTIMGWLWHNGSQIQSAPYVLVKSNSYSMYYLETTSPRFYILLYTNEGYRGFGCEGFSIVNNSWQHYAFVVRPPSLGSSGCYINGRLNMSNTLSSYTSINGTTSALTLGGASADSTFIGKLDELRLYNRSVSDDEISAIYNNTRIRYS